MKNYQKAEMIAKNLPTGSYAAGCPSVAPRETCYQDYPGHLEMMRECKPCEHDW